MFHLVTLFWLQFIIRPPCPHRFWVSQFFCSCSYHLEFPSPGYSKQFYHILFSPPTQNLLQSSFSASLVPPSHPQPIASDSAGQPPTLCALQIHLLTYLLTYTRRKCKFWVSQFFCSCSYHLEFPSLGYSKQFYHILFSPPNGATSDL